MPNTNITGGNALTSDVIVILPRPVLPITIFALFWRRFGVESLHEFFCAGRVKQSQYVRVSCSRRADDVTRERRREGLYVTILLWSHIT